MRLCADGICGQNRTLGSGGGLAAIGSVAQETRSSGKEEPADQPGGNEDAEGDATKAGHKTARPASPFLSRQFLVEFFVDYEAVWQSLPAWRGVADRAWLAGGAAIALVRPRQARMILANEACIVA